MITAHPTSSGEVALPSPSTAGGGLSTAAVAGIGIGSAFAGMAILALIIFLLSSRHRRRKIHKRDISPPLNPRTHPHGAELPTHIYSADAKEGGPFTPISPGSSTLAAKDVVSPIETVLSKEEQDELHALRERMGRMRSELASWEERERQRVELDGGLGGMREMPA